MSHKAETLSVKGGAAVWLALLLLLGATIGAAYLPLHPFNGLVALLIAALKAVLVAVFFMHLKWSSALSRVFAAAGVFWLAILMTLTFADVLTRQAGAEPVPQRMSGRPDHGSAFGPRAAPGKPAP
jgi:cytochrome c oxidase subunit IV